VASKKLSERGRIATEKTSDIGERRDSLLHGFAGQLDANGREMTSS
jgi:hypothetical protein